MKKYIKPTMILLEIECGYAAVVLYARHEHCLTGESPEQALIAGIA